MTLVERRAQLVTNISGVQNEQVRLATLLQRMMGAVQLIDELLKDVPDKLPADEPIDFPKLEE